MAKETKQQRINELGWEIIDIIIPKNKVKKDVEDLEGGLKQVIEQLKQPKGEEKASKK